MREVKDYLRGGLVLGISTFLPVWMFAMISSEFTEIAQNIILGVVFVIGASIGIFGFLKQKVIVNKKKGYIEFPFFVFLSQKVKISEIESMHNEASVTINNGKLSIAYKLSLIGSFGEKSITTSTQGVRATIINHINWARA